MTASQKAPPAAPVSPVPRGLVYVSDNAPGITRQRRGRGFVYRLADGSRLNEASLVQRIRSLAIPPAYTQVWICPHERGHLQATGRDARGRKQYRYHADWRKARDAYKFDRMLDFARALPRIRARVAADLALPVGTSITRDTVLASVVRLLDTTLVRVGNAEYARENGSYGLTTLRNRHAQVRGTKVRLSFRGKSGVVQQVALDDPRVARVVRRCQALPGQTLFAYDDARGQACPIDSNDVNDYLRDAGHGEFTAKDFRTWHASVHALALATTMAQEDSTARARAMLAKQILCSVASRLGNTVAVCRKSYVHPAVLALLLGERALPAARGSPAPRRRGLTRDESAFVTFLGALDRHA